MESAPPTFADLSAIVAAAIGARTVIAYNAAFEQAVLRLELRAGLAAEQLSLERGGGSVQFPGPARFSDSAPSQRAASPSRCRVGLH